MVHLVFNEMSGPEPQLQNAGQKLSSATHEGSTKRVKQRHALADDVDFVADHQHGAQENEAAFLFAPPRPSTRQKVKQLAAIQDEGPPNHPASEDDSIDRAYISNHCAPNIGVSRSNQTAIHGLESDQQDQADDLVVQGRETLTNGIAQAESTGFRPIYSDPEQSSSEVDPRLNGTTQLDDTSTPESQVTYFNPATLESRANNLSSRSGSAPPLMNHERHHGRETQSTRKEHAVLGPQNDSDRVTKSVHSSPTSTRSRSPIEALEGVSQRIEEVLVYLIGRNRAQDEAQKRWQVSSQRLEREKQTLQESMNACQEDIAQVRQQWQIALQHNHVHDAELHDLRVKYENIKQAVQKFARVSEELTKGRDNLIQEVKSLKNTNAVVVKEKKDLLQQCTQSKTQLEKIQSEIVDLRSNSKQLKKIQKELDRSREIIQEEKLRNQEHKLYIQRLEDIQRSWHRTTSAKQDKLAALMKTLASTVESRCPGQPLLEWMQPLTSSLEQIHRDVEGLSKSQIDASEHIARFEAIKKDVKGIQDSISDQHAAADLQFSNINSSIANLEPNLEHVYRLEAAGDRLTQEVASVKKTNLTLQKSHISAQLMCTGLLEHQKQILAREGLDANVVETVRKLTNSRLEAETLVSCKQSEIDKLGTDLKQLTKDLEQKEQEMKTKETQSRAKLQELSTDFQSQMQEVSDQAQQDKTKYEKTLEDQIQRLQDQQNLINKSRAEVDNLKNNVQEAKSRTEEHAGALLEKDARLRTLTTENEQLQVKLNSLKDVEKKGEAVVQDNESLRLRLQEQSDTMQQTQKELTETESQKSELAKDLAARDSRISDAEKKIKALRGDLQEKEVEITSQRGIVASHIKEATNTKEVLKKLKWDLAETEKTSAGRSEEIRNLREQITRNAQAADQEKRKSEATEKEFSEQNGSLATENQTLRNTNEQNKQKLREASSRCNDHSKYQKMYDDQLKRATELDDQLERLSNVRTDLEASTLELSNTQTELNNQRTLNESLSKGLEKFHWMRTWITDSELEELTEDLVLALKSQINASQSQRASDRLDPMDNLTQGHSQKGRRKSYANTQDTQEDLVPDSQSQNARAILGQQGRSPSPELIDSSMSSEAERVFAAHVHPPSGNITFDRGAARPGTSNDEMLLRSPADPSTPACQSIRRPAVQIPASMHSPSPMKTRGGSQIRHTIPETQIDSTSTRAGTPGSQTRDTHAPNSAAKRQHENDESNELVKKPRLQQANLKTLDVPLVRSATSKQLRFADQTTVHPASGTTTRSVGVAGTTAPAPGTMKKRTNTTKPGSRSAAYQSRFSRVHEAS